MGQEAVGGGLNNFFQVRRRLTFAQPIIRSAQWSSPHPRMRSLDQGCNTVRASSMPWDFTSAYTPVDNLALGMERPTPMFWHEAWGFSEVVQDRMSEQGWYSDWKDIEVCFQFSLVCTKSSLQTFLHGTLSNQLYWNSILQPKVGKIHFYCGQTCFEEELNLRLKGGPCDRERQKLDPRFVSFRFISVCTLFSNKRCQRQTEVFTMFHFVQSFLRDTVRYSVFAQRRTIWKDWSYHDCDVLCFTF